MDSTTPVTVAGVTGAVVVAAGTNHSCATVTGGQLKCWGRNDEGELGDGTTNLRVNAVSVNNLSNATTVASSNRHTCAVLSSGEVHCWGYNNHGQVGDDTTGRKVTPVKTLGIP